MMTTINSLGPFKRFRLWVNELPKINYKAVEIEKIQIPGGNNFTLNRKKLCLELFHGPRHVSNYGLIGAEFAPVIEKTLTIILNVSKDNEEILTDNIAFPHPADEVHIGIPKQYASKILKTTEEFFLSQNNIPCGTLTFNIGAHGLVGSSPQIFGKITSIFLNLIMENFDKNLINIAITEIEQL